MFEEELFEVLDPADREKVGTEQPKKVAFTIGRFQPPTLGHYKVVNAMKKFIRENPELKLEASPVIVIVEGAKSSEDKTRNPLTGQERERFMANSGYCNGVKFFIVQQAMHAFGAMRLAGLEPRAIAAGSDRSYMQMAEAFSKGKDKAPLKLEAITGLDRVADAVTNDKAEKKSAMDRELEKLKKGDQLDDAEVSGSLARRAVELGFYDEFKQIVGLEKKDVIARQMWIKIRTALGLGEQYEI